VPSTVTLPAPPPTLITPSSRRSRKGFPAAEAGSVWRGNSTFCDTGAAPPITKRSLCE
jgi:hypothetical protein